MAEKMITLGKQNTLAARREAAGFITKDTVVKKVFSQLAIDYADVKGGYTQIYKLGPRRGDGAEMALIRLVAVEVKKEEEAPAPKKKTTTRKKKVEEAPAVEAPATEAAE